MIGGIILYRSTCQTVQASSKTCQCLTSHASLKDLVHYSQHSMEIGHSVTLQVSLRRAYRIHLTLCPLLMDLMLGWWFLDSIRQAICFFAPNYCLRVLKYRFEFRPGSTKEALRHAQQQPWTVPSGERGGFAHIGGVQGCNMALHMGWGIAFPVWQIQGLVLKQPHTNVPTSVGPVPTSHCWKQSFMFRLVANESLQCSTDFGVVGRNWSWLAIYFLFCVHLIILFAGSQAIMLLFRW